MGVHRGVLHGAVFESDRFATLTCLDADGRHFDVVTLFGEGRERVTYELERTADGTAWRTAGEIVICPNHWARALPQGG
jgi:hypothetical protein